MKRSIVAGLFALAHRAISALPLLVSNTDVLDSYDYVVIGGGTGGMTLASRLSEDGSRTVLLIEAGSLDNGEKEIRIPRFYVASRNGLPEDFKYAWHIKTTPQTELGNRSIPLPQAKLIGGGSGINGMVYDRGRAADYNSWADIGSKGWDFASLLPYFKKAETFTPPPKEQANELKITYDPECHGFEGPVQSSYPAWVYPQHTGPLSSLAFLPVLNFTEDGEAILSGMDVKTATNYLPGNTDPSVAAGYEAQVEHIVKMHKERSTAGQELMYVGGGTGLTSILLHPLSRGSVQLNCTDPFDDPLVDPRYLSHPSDGQILVEIVKYNRKIIATEALQRTGATETFPGTNVTSDEAILESLRPLITTVWHPAGTCAMMPREIGGVVNSELKAADMMTAGA
ncbi:hypothetical protein SLS63_013472 [Diaporthe eres]|uniref:Glucose-methanol-choline oxidoreductase N-terminal domain-containing protein n=1 Tax=Diaporthe eres TaxID=83184 RepID=A0ABR1NNG0_DIAER